MRYLAAVDSVTTAAAIADYLGDRCTADDVVHGVTVHPPEDSRPAGDPDATPLEDRDRREALNVLGVRLAVPEVVTHERRGTVGEELRAVASDEDAAELVLADRGGHVDVDSDAGDAVGSTHEALLRDLPRPTVVVPVPDA